MHRLRTLSDVVALMPSVFELRTPVPGALDGIVGVVGAMAEVGVEDFTTRTPET